MIYFAKASRIYTGARMNNSRSNVYHGDFRKPVKAFEFTHVSVLMRTRLADSNFAALRIMYRFPIDRKRRCIRPWECRLLPLSSERGRLRVIKIFPISRIFIIFFRAVVVLNTPTAAKSATLWRQSGHLVQ